MNLNCSCGRIAERNGYCSTCNRTARKLEQKANKPAPVRKAIKPRSDKRAKQESEYNASVKEWKEGKECALKGYSECEGEITCHHRAGRRDSMLLDERYWMPVCLGHHIFLENHPHIAWHHGWSLSKIATEKHKI